MKCVEAGAQVLLYTYVCMYMYMYVYICKYVCMYIHMFILHSYICAVYVSATTTYASAAAIH
jgi:hypothetical protein